MVNYYFEDMSSRRRTGEVVVVNKGASSESPLEIERSEAPESKDRVGTEENAAGNEHANSPGQERSRKGVSVGSTKQDRDDPAFVPQSGPYFLHDTRFGGKGGRGPANRNEDDSRNR